jgi:hypothetical protein
MPKNDLTLCFLTIIKTILYDFPFFVNPPTRLNFGFDKLFETMRSFIIDGAALNAYLTYFDLFTPYEN